MRLSDVLSKPISEDFVQVEGFLNKETLKAGRQKKIDIGIVSLTYFCKKCDMDITFNSCEQLYCIGVDSRKISIDCVLKCPRCGELMPLWFLIESEKNLNDFYPKVRILKRTEKFTDNVAISRGKYGDVSILLENADRANRNELGAGAIVYLRKIFEKITDQVALTSNISTLYPSGKKKNFRDLLEEVDNQCHIIPQEFAANGYQLFRELSSIVHNGNDDNDILALKKYDSLRRLVVGILDNIINNNELTAATVALGWV